MCPNPGKELHCLEFLTFPSDFTGNFFLQALFCAFFYCIIYLSRYACKWEAQVTLNKPVFRRSKCACGSVFGEVHGARRGRAEGGRVGGRLNPVLLAD